MIADFLMLPQDVHIGGEGEEDGEEEGKNEEEDVSYRNRSVTLSAGNEARRRRKWYDELRRIELKGDEASIWSAWIDSRNWEVCFLSFVATIKPSTVWLRLLQYQVYQPTQWCHQPSILCRCDSPGVWANSASSVYVLWELLLHQMDWQTSISNIALFIYII